MGTVTVTKPEATLFEPDYYGAKIVAVDEVDSPAYQKKQYKIKFEITDADSEFTGKSIAYWVNRTFSVDDDGDEVESMPTGSNLFKVVMAANGGVEPVLGDSFDVAEFLLGKKVRINIINKKGTDGKTRSKVDIVVAVKRQKAAA